MKQQMMSTSMTERTRILFSLLRDALWLNEEILPHELTEQDAAEVFALAKKQAVAGLVLDALIRHDVKMTKQRVFEAIGFVEQIKQQSRRVDDGVKKLHHVFTDNGIKYVVVKGQPVASLYPDPLLRQSGDIDYYCDEKNFPLSQVTVERVWGIETEKHGSDKHVHFDLDGIIYEGHFALADLYSKKRNAYWQQLLDSDNGAITSIDGVDVRSLSPSLHVFYVFLHLYHHLLALGVGLRQFCDMAVLLHYNKDHIDFEQLQKHLRNIGMVDAYRACGSVLVDYLGLPYNELGCTLTDKDHQYAKMILDVVLYRGNMGHYNKRSGFKGWKHKVEATGIKISHFAKFVSLAPSYSFGWMMHEFGKV